MMTTMQRIANLTRNVANMLTAEELEQWRQAMKREAGEVGTDEYFAHAMDIARHMVAWRGQA